jgi:hypothetical protein
MNNNTLVDSLEIADIKNNLKEFLKGQTQFKDYNFEGSNLNILLDILAYNTYYNLIYQNMSLNEAFLDSASKRSSVISIAKSLGYIPRSMRASKAKIDMTESFETSATQLLLEKGQVFTSQNNGSVYNFILNDNVISDKSDNGSFYFPALELIAGSLISETYIYDGVSKMILGNQNIDTSTLEVKVFNNINDTNFTIYTLSENITSQTSDSTVYYLEETESGQYQLLFGDNIVSKSLNFGNVISVTYVSATSENADGCNNFKAQLEISGTTNIRVDTTVKSVSTGWSERETISEIKYLAPKVFSTQNRCVTPGDVSTLILSKFPNAETVSYWDGTENTPIAYNTMFLSVKPKYSTQLIPAEKDLIKNEILKTKIHPGVSIVFKDPEYLDVKLNSTVYINKLAISGSIPDLYNSVKNRILEFYKTTCSGFGDDLKFSKLVKYVDDTDVSITHNHSSISMLKAIAPKLNIFGKYTIDFGNPIQKYSGSVTSTYFYLQESDIDLYFLSNDEKGSIWISRLVNESIEYTEKIGFVNFSTGLVEVSGLNISALESGKFIIKAASQSNDITVDKNQIIRILPENIELLIKEE